MERRTRWLTAGLGCVAVLGLLWPGSSGSQTKPEVKLPQRPAAPPEDGKLRILCFGAHPDDCELQAGGVALLWAGQGHHVKFVSVTNGDIGHWREAGGPLARRRKAEVEAAAVHAKAKGARVVLNLAPAGPPGETLLKAIDVLVVNEHEALTLGEALKLSTREPEEVAAYVDRTLGVATIVTLGPAGAVGYSKAKRFAAPAPKVEVVDTTGAGDTFVGAFAAALDRGLGFEAAMKRGLAAGSLACTKPGAQPSMPYAAEIEALAAKAG